jgi:hypothetical protein
MTDATPLAKTTMRAWATFGTLPAAGLVTRKPPARALAGGVHNFRGNGADLRKDQRFPWGHVPGGTK